MSPDTGVVDRGFARGRLKGSAMYFSRFLIAFVVLFVAWALGGFVFHVAGGLIHVLLAVAVILLIVHFLRGRP